MVPARIQNGPYLLKKRFYFDGQCPSGPGDTLGINLGLNNILTSLIDLGSRLCLVREKHPLLKLGSIFENPRTRGIARCRLQWVSLEPPIRVRSKDYDLVRLYHLLKVSVSVYRSLAYVYKEGDNAFH